MVEELITKLRLLFDGDGVDKAKKSIKELEGSADSANKATAAGADRSTAAMGQAGTAARRLGDDLQAAGSKAEGVGAAGETAGQRAASSMEGARGAVKGLGDELAGAGSKGDEAGRQIGSGAEEAERKTGSAKGAVSGLAAGLVALGAVAYFGGILHDLGEVDRLAIQSQTTIRTTGGVANVTAAHVAALGDSFERLTGLESEGTQAAENLLLTFTNIRNEVGAGNDVFDRATRLTQDLAVAGFGTASSAAVSLGKALNDPIAGINALARQGLTFTDQQKALIRSLVATGDTLGAQKVILAELERQVGGSAEAYGTTLPGKLAKARNAIDNVSEGFVRALVPGLEAAANVVTPLANAFSDMPAPLQAVASVLGIAGAAAVLFGGRIKDGVANVKEMTAAIATKFGAEEAGTALNFAGQAAGFLGKSLAIVGTVVVARSFLDNLAPSAKSAASELARGAGTADDFRAALERLNNPSLKDNILSGVRDVLHLDFSHLIGGGTSALELFQKLAEQSPGTAQSVVNSLKAQGVATDGYEQALDKVVSASASAAIGNEQLSAKAKAAAQAQRDQAAASGDLAAKQDQLKGRYDALNDSVDRFKGLLDATLGVQISSKEATLRANEALATLHQALTDNGTSLDNSTDKGRANQRAVLDLVGAIEDEIDAWARSGAITDDDNSRKAALIKRLQELQAEFPPLRGEIQQYIDKISAIPTAPVTTPVIDTGPAERALADLQSRLYAFAQSNNPATIALSVLTGGLALPQRMAGGPVRADQPVIVGEKRAEVWWPDRPGTILPDLSVLENLAGGRSVQVMFSRGAVTIDARGVPGADALADRLVDLVHGELANVLDRVVVRELALSLGAR